MRAIELATRLTVYYIVVTGLVLAGIKLVPGFEGYLPIGGAEALISHGVNTDPFSTIEIGATRVHDFKGTLLWLVFAVVGSVLTVLPMAWTYMAVRTSEEYDQSIVETVMVLPIAVTSIVVLVSQSIALAFGLAGIVGGVRFRNSLKSSGDALFILAAIGIGLAAGVGALEIALVMTVIFNYCFLALWLTDFGARKGSHRYMRRAYKKAGDDETPLHHLKNGNGKKHKSGAGKNGDEKNGAKSEPIPE
jgi:hypothetical protein